MVNPIGAWTLGPSLMTGQCGAATMSVTLSGISVAVRTVGAEPLRLDLGCRCQLPLSLSGEPASIQLEQATHCEFMYNGRIIAAEVTAVSLGPGLELGSLAMELSGEATTIQWATLEPIRCQSFKFQGELTSTPSASPGCGPDSTAIGVVPVSTTGIQDCSPGAGRDGLFIVMHEDNETIWPQQSGERGEGAWALPQTRKYDDFVSSQSDDSVLGSRDTWLRFCRVDGSSFRPLLPDSGGAEQSYAVLKLGQTCPQGSVEMVETIDNEDIGNTSWYTGKIDPNQVMTENGASITELHFCHFRAASLPDEGMASFPDLAFPYAVFHDFDGPQPPWVILKLWMYSRADSRSTNSFISTADDPETDEQFQQIVESPTDATFFELARVR